jgi:type IX secretion system PorP/SprF family membrane protein
LPFFLPKTQKKNTHKPKFWALCILACLNQGLLIAQDIQFSQTYNNSLFLNPALAGASRKTRAMLHHRTQWHQLDANYISSMAGGDHYSEKLNSGFGCYFLYDQQGQSILNSYEIAAQYAYELVLQQNIVVRLGLQGTFVNRSLDYSKLIFPDQIDNQGNVGSTQASVSQTNVKSNNGDISSGIVVYGNKIWGGYSSHHMNRPQTSFLGTDARWPIKHTFITGYKHYIQKPSETQREKSITPTAHYKMQGKSDQFDIGIFGIYYPTMLGIWYRGIPFLKQYNTKLQNNESVSIMIGAKFKNAQFSYSYDVVVSKLAPANTGGAHEINIIYYFAFKKNSKKPMKRLPCPELFDEK